MNRLVPAALVALALSGSTALIGQGRDPFFDRSDTGEIIHVLPPPAAIRSPHDTSPTFAPISDRAQVFGASYGSGRLTDHGGPEIPTAGFWAIYWNNSVAHSTQTSLGYSTIAEEIKAFVNSFADNASYDGSATDDYTIVQQYGSTKPIANSIATAWDVTGSLGYFVDGQPSQSSIGDSKIRNYLAGLLGSGKVRLNENIVYGIYFPPGMKVTLPGGSSCSTFCGYHSHFSYNGHQIKYAVFPYLNCTACKLSTLTVADMLTIVTSHEIREAVTDPGDGGVNAWYDASGYEADDKCAWHHLYQLNSGNFWVQPEYSNGGSVTASGFTATYAGPGCVVPYNNPVVK